MKISNDWQKFIHVGQPGFIYLTPEDADDIWILYNLIVAGDEVEASTIRRIVQENNQGTVVDSQKIKITLAVIAEKIDVDLQGASLRINGKNVKENRHVKLGSYHTLDLEPDRQLKITKHEWDHVAYQYLYQAATAVKAELGAILVQEGHGLAFVCTLSPTSSEPRILERIQVSLGKKKLGSTSSSDKQLEKFHQAIFDSVEKHLNFAKLKAIILVVGPRGDLESFYSRMIEWAMQNPARKANISDYKNKIVRIGASQANEAHPSQLVTMLHEPKIASALADTKSAIEARTMDRLHKSLNENCGDDASPLFYGTFSLPNVEKAAEDGAIKELLLADKLFRSCKVAERKRYSKLIETVRDNGGSIMIVSSAEFQDDLMKLSGIAALLHYPSSY